MKFSAISFSALVSLASAVSIQLTAQVANTDYTGLFSVHEGAGINFVQVGASSQTLDYDVEASVISFSSGPGITQPMIIPTVDPSTGFPFLQLSVAGGAEVYWAVCNGKLIGTTADGKDVTFYAAKNVSDPYNYSKNAFLIGGTTVDISDYNLSQAIDLQAIEIDVEFV